MTSYLDTRQDKELEEGEISELEYMDKGEDELQYPDNISSEDSNRRHVQHGSTIVHRKPSTTVQKAVSSPTVDTSNFTAVQRSKEMKLELAPPVIMLINKHQHGSGSVCGVKFRFLKPLISFSTRCPGFSAGRDEETRPLQQPNQRQKRTKYSKILQQTLFLTPVNRHNVPSEQSEQNQHRLMPQMTMDTKSNSYSSQDSETGLINSERNRPRTPFNLANPDQHYIAHGERTYSEMYFFHHMHEGRVLFPDNRLLPVLLEATDFIHQPSAVRDSLGYHDHSQTMMRNITNLSPEAIVEQYNPNRLPGPGHPLSGNGQTAELEPGEFKQGVEDLIRSCSFAKHLMNKVWLDADNYHMLDGTTRELCKMQERDADDYYNMLDANRLEETVFIDELPLVEEANLF
ncbi:hypothetical protein C8J56DRAFT_894316 [Mycena floridula]|nr:hypothetical protein C8J56DRAFT_894316 [Mycena floridula]